MSNNSGGKFRKKRTNFSMVSNDIIRNDSVSLKAKGLYALIQSYITIDNFTIYKGFLQSKCIEGERAFDSAWRELKEKGYLVQYKLKDENNKYYYEYELLDEPKPPPQNVGMEISEKPPPHFAGVQNEKVQSEEFQTVGDTNIIKSNVLRSNILSNHITEKDVMEQIGYEPQIHDDFIENIVLIMVEVLNMPDNAILKINQLDLPVETVKERFRKVHYKHLEYIKLIFQDFTGEISSMKNYMITTIYNAPATCDIYFAHRVNRDQYKDSSQHIA